MSADVSVLGAIVFPMLKYQTVVSSRHFCSFLLFCTTSLSDFILSVEFSKQGKKYVPSIDGLGLSELPGKYCPE